MCLYCHICLSILSTLHSQSLTVTQHVIPSFVESNHMDLPQDSTNDSYYRTGLGLCHYSNQADSGDDVIGLIILFIHFQVLKTSSLIRLRPGTYQPVRPWQAGRRNLLARTWYQVRTLYVGYQGQGSTGGRAWWVLISFVMCIRMIVSMNNCSFLLAQ